MTVPLIVLAVGSTLAGMIWYGDFFGHNVTEFFGAAIYTNHETNHVLHDAHSVPVWVGWSPFIAMLIGLFLAWLFYIRRPGIAPALAEMFQPAYQFLLNKWYFDEVYDVIFVGFAKWLGRFLWKKGDGAVIDGTINGVAMGIVPYFTRLSARMQSGYLYHYALIMVLGVVGLVTWMSISGGGH